MTLQSVDRTCEQERSSSVLTVTTEDTCCFWTQRERSLICLKRCFFCKYFQMKENSDGLGTCLFKASRK